MRYGTQFPLRVLALIGLSALLGTHQAGAARGQATSADQPPDAEAAATADQPAETAPAESAPAEPAPTEAAPAESASAEPASAETPAAEPAPTATAPAEPAPAEAAPAKAAPTEPTPAETPPAEPAPPEPPPTEPAPAETPPTEPAPAEGEPEKPDFTQLADPEVADRLKLSPDQRERITELLEERKEKLAAAPEATEEARQAILDETQKKLADVLTQVQYGDFVGKPVEKRLTFMFRYQQWSEVLDWFAEQAELSLVIPEAPPPGTFNYTDTREYTPTEAIDLMNGVLIRKGYTLVRRGRMLMVINLEQGIPEGVAPQVELDQLDKRGKYELVTVRFPIGRRSAETVTEAIKSFTSQYGKVLVVAATQEVVVTDMAGIMPEVNRIIEALPEPPAPPPSPEPAVPQPPELRVYSVKVADPETALSVLTQMIPTATFVLDPDTKRINANATPSQHSLVESVLEKMEEEIPEEKKRVLEVYPIEEFLGVDLSAAAATTSIFSRRRSFLPNGSGEALQKTLQKIAPEAELAINPQTKTLVVWATPADQEKIKAALEKLRVDLGPEETPQFETYRLSKVDPEATLTLLETLLPDARLTVDTRTRTLIAVAPPADQEVISRTLKTLQPEEPGPDAPELRFYELALAMPPSLLDAVQKVAPGATVAMDASGERLMAVATPAEHGKIEKTIEHMKKTTFIEGRSNLEFYPVTPAQRKRFQAVLDSLTAQLPGMKVIVDAQPGELAIWAKPQQHDVLKDILDELKKDVAEAAQYQLVGYPIRSADPPSVLEMLQQLFPDTKLVLDPKTNRLLAWTSPAEHASIKASLEQLATEAPAEDQPRFNAYLIQGVDLQAAGGSLFVSELQALVPGARLTTDARTNKLVAYATPKEHELIKAALATLEVGGTPETTPTVEVYPLTQADSTATLSLLQTLVPDAQLTVGVKGDRLIARAVAADHETIQATLKKLEPETSGPDSPQLVFYPFRREPSASLMTILGNLVPKAEITLDTDQKRLIVMARPSEHEKIKATIEKFTEGAADTEPQLVVYPIKTIDASSLLTVLQTLVPDAQVSIEAQTGNLVALAYSDEHQIIQDTLDQLQPETPGPDTPVLRFHPMRQQPPADLLTVLGKLVPKAQITLDTESRRLMAVATAEDHDAIQATIEQFETSATRLPELRFHPLVQELPADVLAVLSKLAPKAQITLDAENKRLMVVASAEDHEVIKSTVEEYEATTPLQEPSKLAVYPVTAAQRKRFELLQPTLAEEMPGMKVVGEPAPGELAIWAKPTEHMLLAGIMEQLEAEVPEAQRRKLVGYTIRSADPNSVLDMLQNLYPDTEFVLDLKANRLLVLTRPDEHESIKSSLSEIEAAGLPEEQPRFDRFPLFTSDATTIISTLQPLVPNARLTVDTRTKQLIAWGTPTELEIIRTAVEGLTSDTTAQTRPTLKVYHLKKADPQTTLTLLQGLVPGVELTLEPESKRLIANALPAEHEEIEATLEKIEVEVPAEDQPRFATYAIPAAGTTEAASTFVAALQPLVPEAKLTVDVKTRKLIALAAPEEQEIIRKAVESMGAGAGENISQLQVYRLTKADPNSVLALLENLLPEAQLSIDTQTNSLAALAVPADQETIKSTLDQIEAQGPAEDQPRFQTYPIYGADTAAAASTFVTSLQPLVPGAKLTVDSKGKKLIVFGTPAEHELVGRAMESMGRGGDSPETTPQLEVYRLTKADPNSVLALLETLLPDAQFSVDAKTNSLVALAVPADQATIKATLDELQPEKPGPDTPVLRFHVLLREPSDNLVAAIQPLVPRAQLTLDTENDRIMAVATPADHEIIKSTIEQFEASTPPDEPNKLVVYPVTPAQKARLQAIVTTLTEEFPGIQVIADEAPDEVAVWAKPTQHVALAEIIEQLKGELAEGQKRQLVAYRVKSADPTSVLTVMQELFPEVRFVLEPKTNRLLVWTRPEEHESIKASLEKIETAGPPEDQPRFQTYPIYGAGTAAVAGTFIATLQPLVPNAKLTLDAQGRKVIAWGTPEEHEIIGKAMERLGRGGDSPETTPQLEVYQLTKADPTSTLTLLQNLVPDAQLSIDPQTNSLVALAIPADQAAIKATLEQLQPEKPGPNTPVLRFHVLLRKPADNLLAVLQPLVPKAQITVDTENDRVMAVATPADHETIQSAIREFEASTPPEEPGKLVVYNVTASQRKRLEALLPALAEDMPGVQIIGDGEPGEVAVWAKPTEHLVLAEIIKELKGDATEDQKSRLGVYAIHSADPQSVLAVLQRLFPDNEFIADEKTRQIMVWTSPAEQEKIKSAIEAMDTGVPGEWEAEVGVYPVPNVDPAAAIQFLQQLLPDVQFATDTKRNAIIAWGWKSDHERIAKTLEQMSTEGPAEMAPTARVYTLESITPTAATQILAQAVPQAQVSTGPGDDQLAVWASPKDHKIIESALAAIDVESPTAKDANAVIYALEGMSQTGTIYALQFLSETIPEARFTAGAQEGQIVAWASPEVHEQIARLVDQLTQEAPEKARRIVVYTLKSTTATNAMQVLSTAVPQANVTLDTDDPQKLTVWARPAEHETIAGIFDEIDVEGAAETASRAEVYTIQGMTAPAALSILGTQVPQARVSYGSDPQQLVVWARPAEHERVRQILDEIAAATEQAGAARQMVVYTLDSLTASTAMQLLGLVVPQAQLSPGADTDQLVAWALPQEHDLIERTLERIDVEGREEAEPVIYPLEGMTASSASYVLLFLTRAVPNAEFIQGVDPTQVIAWARPKDHERIAQLIERLTTEPPEKARKATVYNFDSITAASATQVLQKAVPQATFVPDAADAQKLTVWARPSEHETIAEILREIDVEGQAATDSKLKIYTIEGMTAYGALTILQTQVPQARVSLGTDPQQLVVWARPADHEKINQIVEEIVTVATEGEAARVAQVYTLESLTATAATTFLQQAVPQAKLSPGAQPDQLMVWARPQDHEKIARTLKQIDVEGPEDATAVVYTLEGVSSYGAASYVISFLTTAFPEARFVLGADPSQVVAWARPKDHEEIGGLIDQMMAGPPPERAPKAVVYNLKSISAASANQVLAGAVPNAKLTTDTADPQKLTALATAKDHETIAAILEEIDVESPTETTSRVEIYTLEGITAASALPVLRTSVPQARISPGTDPQQLIVWARPADHKMIQEMVDQMAAAAADAEMARVPETYTLRAITASTAMQILGQVVPEAQLSPGAEPDQFIALARSKDHELIEKTLEKVDVEGPEDAVPMVYVLEGMDTRFTIYTLRFLRDAVPNANFTIGADPQQLVVWARPKDQEEIGKLVKELTKKVPELTPQAVVYTVKSISPDHAIDVLQKAVPEGSFTTSEGSQKLTAVARPADQELIGRILEEIDVEEPADAASSAVVYTLKWITPTTAMGVLQSAVPEAEFTEDSELNQVIAWAKPADHAAIKKTLEQIDVEGSSESAVKVVAYPLPGVESRRAYYAMSFIRDAVPEATITLNTDSTQLIAWARPKDHKRIAELIEQVLRERPELARKMAVYTLKWTTAAKAMEILEEAVRGADFSVGDDPQQLIAWARPAEHEVIETTLREIDLEPSPETATGAVVYTLKSISPDEATQILQQAVPKASFTADEASQKLTALARPADHEMIQRILEEIDVEGPAEAASSAILYTLEYATPATAIEVLQSAVPDARFTESSEPNQVVAWARPKDHEIIRRTLETIDVEGPADKIARAVVYPLRGMEIRRAIYALRFLQESLPEAKFTLSADGGQLIAFATPKDHETLEGLVKQLTEELPELARRAEAYDLKYATAADAIQALQEAVPEASLSPGATENQVVAWARPDDHRKIVEILDQLDREPPQETEPRAVAYSLEAADATEALRILREAVPKARVSIGAEPHQLIAWARPADHEIIDQIIQKIVEQGPDELAPRVAVYTLETTDAEGAIAFLRAAVPEAELSIGTDPRRMIAWARPRDHEIIARAVEAMSEKESPETAPRVVVYTLKTTDAAKAIEILQEAVPDARFTVGADTRQLLAWARPADHEIIDEAVEKMSQEEPLETRPRVEVYDLESTGAANAIQLLQAAVPEAKLGVGSDPGKLVAWARPEDHEIIRAAVEQFEADSWLEGKRIISVYPIKAGDAQSLVDVLKPELQDHARFVVDSERNSLIVWADPKHHEMIDKTVREFMEGLEGTQEMSSVVYRFQLADPSAALSVLQTLVPSARLALDPNTQSIVASALPEDHAKIKATIDEMEREDAEGQRPVLRVHRVTAGSASNVLGSLYALFRQDPTVQLSLDSRGESIVAIASPIKHEKIDQLIKEVEKGVLLDSANVLQLYSMKNIDTESAMEILDRLMEKRGAKADLSLDSRSNQLVAIARPDHHELIEETLEQLRREEPDLEIYDLEYVDPLSAEMAILSEFEDEGRNAPQVDVDPVTQQLFVRANQEQHQRIRQLLIKMGEIKLQLLGDRGTEAMRVIPFHGDLESAIEEIKRAWPELGERIRIITPSTTLPEAAKPAEPKPAEPAPKEAPPAEAQPKPEPPKEAPAEPATKEAPPAEPQPKPEPAKEAPAEPKPEPAAKPEEAKPAEPSPDDSAMDEAWRIFAAIELGSPSEADQSDQPSPANSAKESKPENQPPDESPPPIYVVVGEGSVTLVSDDPEALDQLERLLRALLPSTGTIGRNISIFELKHSNAAAVAEKLEELFTASPFSWRRGIGSVVIVPDERLNTILVQGSRIDRETVEGLLTILDSDKVPEALAADKPNLVPIKNVDAEQIAEVIRSVFKSQMTPPTTSRDQGRRASTRLRVPQVAVDEGTNSLVVMAESPLLEEIIQLAEKLDEAAGENPARRIKIIPLEKTDAGRVQKALEQILNTGSSRRRR